jgi:hypothetical protein
VHYRLQAPIDTGPSRQDRRTTRPRHRGRLAVTGVLLASIGLLAGAGVYAGLSATATGAESVSSGTLDLTLSKDVGVGFSTFTGKMAPGDTDNVFVNLNNTGTLASAAGMTLTVTGAPSSALVNGSIVGEGLTVSVARCPAAWNLATGACPGATTTILAPTAVSGMSAGKALSNIPALAATTGRVAHVRVTVGMTATEKSVNGVTPVPSVQGLTAALSFLFTERQRTAVANHR